MFFILRYCTYVKKYFLDRQQTIMRMPYAILTIV